MKRTLSALLIPLAALAVLLTATPEPAAQKPPTGDVKEEYKARRKKTSRKDAKAQYELAVWCLRNGLEKRAKRHLNTVIKLDPNHAEARKKLGHVYDAKTKSWLTEKDQEKLKDKRKEEEMAAKGLAKYKGKWIPKEDAERLEAGMVKVGDEWYTKKDAAMVKKGYVRHPQTNEWIKQGDMGKALQGLFPVNGKWVTEDKANEYHSAWDNRWQVRSKHYVIHTNVPWKTVLDLKNRIELNYNRIKELAFGVTPLPEGKRLNVFVFGTLSDYNAYGGECGTSYSSVSGGWFSLGDREGLTPAVCHWDKNFGAINLAHAMAYQYAFMTMMIKGRLVEIDPQGRRFLLKMPRWVLPAFACYGDRWWDHRLRKWAGDNIVKNGGLASFTEGWFKGFELDATFDQASRQNIRNAGFVVYYIKHSGDAKAAKLWEDIFKRMGESTGGKMSSSEAKARSKELTGMFKELEKHLAENKDKMKECFQRVMTGG